MLYQPIVDAIREELVGIEALIRITGNGSQPGPAEFNPVAEAAGLVTPLDIWAVEEAGRQLAT